MCPAVGEPPVCSTKGLRRCPVSAGVPVCSGGPVSRGDRGAGPHRGVWSGCRARSFGPARRVRLRTQPVACACVLERRASLELARRIVVHRCTSWLVCRRVRTPYRGNVCAPDDCTKPIPARAHRHTLSTTSPPIFRVHPLFGAFGGACSTAYGVSDVARRARLAAGSRRRARRGPVARVPTRRSSRLCYTPGPHRGFPAPVDLRPARRRSVRRTAPCR